MRGITELALRDGDLTETNENVSAARSSRLNVVAV